MMGAVLAGASSCGSRAPPARRGWELQIAGVVEELFGLVQFRIAKNCQ